MHATTATWTDTPIATGDGAPSRALVHRGDGAALVVHLHGGAFVGGEPGSRVARLLAEAGASVVSLDYPLAPAHPFPAGAEAAHAALAWARRERRRLAGPQARLYVCGEEAGGNIAAAAALMARDRGGPDLAGLLLLSPLLDACCGSASQRETRLDADECPWARGWRLYLAAACDVMHPYATPGSSIRLAGLPRTLLITAHDDPLRDETLAFAARLRRAGVATDTADLPHPTGWPLAYTAPGTDTAWAAPVRTHFQRFLRSSA